MWVKAKGFTLPALPCSEKIRALLLCTMAHPSLTPWLEPGPKLGTCWWEKLGLWFQTLEKEQVYDSQ